MSRIRAFAPLLVGVLVAAALLWMRVSMRPLGYVSASDLDLWGRTLLANDGLVSVENIVTAFPPLPYIATIGLHWLAPGMGVVAPGLLAVLLAGGLAMAWFFSLRQGGFGPGASLIATLLLTANPLFLRAVSEGPGLVLLHWGIWLLALGMFNLRRAYRVNDIILVSMALVVMVFSHPFGLILAFAGLPFLALVVPPNLLGQSPWGVFMVLLFPLFFTAASFLYVNWIFTGDAFHFLATLSRETASLGARSGAGFPAERLKVAAIAAIGILAVCPVGVAMAIRTRHQRPLYLALIALAGLLLCATLLAAAFGLLPPPALTIGLGCTLAAACAARWPLDTARHGPILVGLLAGLIGGSVVAFADGSAETTRWREAALGQQVGAPDTELARLAHRLRGRDDILFDAEAAPAVIAERGSARGIVTGDTPRFRLMTLRHRTDASFLVVRNRRSRLGSDRLGRTFPDLYEDGAPGYRLLFDGQSWRAFESIEGVAS